MTHPDPDIPPLAADRRDALLRRIGVLSYRPDRGGLDVLVRAWLTAIPFHNLDLLAASLDGGRSLDPGEAVRRCERGLGGPCHVHAAAFLSLLLSCGFDASLGAATITEPGDHLVVRVSLPTGVHLCDVGNGQPYLVAFSLDRVTEVSHLGWTARAEPFEDGLRLRRWSPDLPSGKVVYVARPEPRRWSDFADAIARHHTQLGYGPFMTSLRAVRIGEDRVDTLRDDQWATYDASGFGSRRVPPGEIKEVLARVFRLDEGLRIDAALRAWATQRDAGRR